MRSWLAALLVAGLAVPAAAENLTLEMRKLLKDAGLEESIMAGLDKELAVPPAMIAAAKKEGKLRVQLQMSEQEFGGVAKLFRARYPGIELEYIRGIGSQIMKVLVAYKTGTVTTDVLSGYDSRVDEFRAVGLVDLRDLPAYPSLREELKTPQGTDGADKLNYWCTSYSTERVKKEDVPTTWDDLLDNPRWRGGKLAVAYMFGSTTLPTLTVRLGDAWMSTWLAKLFNEVRPQLRKETLAATGKLISVGEFDMVFAIQDYVTERDSKRGMPVAARCPEPLVTSWGKLGILSATPHLNAAKLYVNWHLSKEGQIANYHFARQVPVHAALTGREFLPYPDEILGKMTVYRTDDVVREQPRVVSQWNQHWQRAGGVIE